MVKKEKDGKTEERILEAARKVFLTRGMDGARMQDIADEAGINKALLHYYFRDKDRLFDVVFLEEAQKFFPKINAIFASDEPLFSKIGNFVSEYIDEMQANPGLPWFVLNEVNRNPDAFMEKIWGKNSMPQPGKFLEQIGKEIKAGRIRKTEPLQLMMNMISLTIFPFVARPVFSRILQLNPKQFNAIMEDRKKEIPRFIMDAISK